MKKCLSKSSKKLQKHQFNLASAFMDSKNSGAIAIHGVGTGKTLSSVAISKCYLDKFPDHKVIFISPASLVAGFKKELDEYGGDKNDIKKYSFFTFDSFLNYKGNCKKNLVIIDEGQNLRNPDSKKTKHILGCAINSHKIIILSATPMVNSSYDIESLLSMVHKKQPFDRKTFQNILEDKKLSKEYFGCSLSFYENDAKTTQKFFPYVEKIFVPIVMNSITEKFYNTVENDRSAKNIDMLFEMDDNNKKDLQSFHNGLRRVSVSAGGYKNSQKINFIMSFIEHIRSKKPNKALGITQKMIETHTNRFVIFSHFKGHGEELITKRLKLANLSYGLINGTVSKKKRNELVDEYVKGIIKILIITEAGAEGLNLFKTGYVFLVDPGWTESERIQVEGRAVRYLSHHGLKPEKRNVFIMTLVLIKSKEKKNFTNLISDRIKYNKEKYPPSIDLKMIVDSKRKQKQIDSDLDFLRKNVKTLEKCNSKKSVDINDFIDKIENINK